MITFRALAEEVLVLRDQQGIRGLDRERSRYRTHIETSELIDRPITDIAPRDIRAWLRWMAQRDAQVRENEEPRKLDRATISRSLSLISAVFVEAVEREIIELNPCAAVKQKRRVDESDTVDSWAYLLPAEQVLLLECDAVPRHLRLAARFAMGTGLRQGEQINLELADLHVDGGDPHVHVRFSNPHKGKKVPPKSGKRRKVPLVGDALQCAREWLAFLPSFAPSNPLGLVFPTARGKRRPEGKIVGRGGTMRPHYRAAGITLRPHLCWHSLRHTYASNLVREGVRLEVIQVLMGHSSITITQRYAHLGEDAVAAELRATIAPAAADTERMLLPDALDTLRDLGVFDNEEEELNVA